MILFCFEKEENDNYSISLPNLFSQYLNVAEDFPFGLVLKHSSLCCKMFSSHLKEVKT